MNEWLNRGTSAIKDTTARIREQDQLLAHAVTGVKPKDIMLSERQSQKHTHCGMPLICNSQEVPLA